MATAAPPPPPASGPLPPPEGPVRRRITIRPVNWLLLVPLVATLLPGFYNRIEPRLWGIPFFYWYQLAAIAIGVACTLVVYLATRGER